MSRGVVWISDLNWHRVLRFYFSVFSSALVSIEKICQTLKTDECLTTFPNTSKFVKNIPLRVVFQLSSRCLEMWSNTAFRV